MYRDPDVVADTITMGSTPAATDVSDMARWSVLEGMLGPVFNFNAGVLVYLQIVNKIICWEPDHNMSVSWLVMSESSVRRIECMAVASTSVAVYR